MTVERRICDRCLITIMGAEDTGVFERELIDTGAPEYAADGLHHVEVSGSLIKWVYYTVRWRGDLVEQRECVIVSVPIADIDGGIEFIRKRYRGKLREVPQNAVAAVQLQSAVN